eukprot:CAMPEP_0183734618 /NCGR_PEP_ID=MMETSP0737-20130205/44289_1 /TAXON_ID=385413 /ORGANISM="Thalassiosira miniscula, Strain CCMP1093" /LENGTH=917 /DNA_ID=CAMNT_0025968145 /DNA_START=198 /DNA_END=2951 /DNA_ORIENTATION=-
MSEKQAPPPVDETDQSQQHQEQATGGDNNDHGALFARLRTQVDFYFSPQNLARDKYLRNMLNAEHPEMPTPRPAQHMCPVGVITNFPKVKDICAKFGPGRDGQPPEPPALLLAKALDGSSVVTISSDGNWIGPSMQQLPPPTMAATPTMGAMPAHQFQQPHQFQQQQPPHPPFQQGPTGSYPQPQPNPMPMMVPPGAAAMQYQSGGMPLSYPPPSHVGQYPNMNAAPIISIAGSESPSSASLESMPSQQQQQAAQQQQGNMNDNVVVALMDLPPDTGNPIEILSAFTTDTIRPKSAFLDHGNTNRWFVSFGSEADAKAAILASSERTIGGMPVNAKLKSELLPASSTASLSSISAPGPMMQQQQPVPLMGQPGVGYPIVHQGPSPPPPSMATPPPMGVGQNIMPGGYPPQYPMPPPQIQPPPQLAGMPPGQPYAPYGYNPQHQMQQMYPGNYMPQHQQGGIQQQMPQMQPYPPHMANRFGVVPPLPPPPRASYPGGPPPPYPYQGIHHQYLDGYGGHYQHGQMGPSRQYSDRRQVGPGIPGAGGGFHDHQGHKGNNKKKKKNQQQIRRESYGSSSNDNGFRRNNEYNNYGHQHHLRYDNSNSPILDQRGKWKSKRGDYGDQSSFRRGSPSPSFQRNYNRHQNDRLSSSDRTPSQSSSNRQTNNDGDRDIFSSSDFPGLGGGVNDDKSEKSNTGDGNSKQHLVGYASALLKKNEAEDTKEGEDMAASKSAVATDNQEVDSITRQTEEMEREILSEFHDLSLIGDGNTNVDTASSSSSPSPAKTHISQGQELYTKTEANDDKTDGTVSSSTVDANAMSHPNTNNLPILPAGPFSENDGGVEVISQSAYSSEPPAQQQLQPQFDVTNSQDFPSKESTQVIDDGVVESPSHDQTSSPSVLMNDEQPKPTGAWGSKRFADVI